MEIQKTKFGLRLYFTFNIRRVEKVQGVNSRVKEDTHFLMWDFDDIPLAVVKDSLLQVQELFNLPEINIISTGKPNGYHAYCFKSCNFVEARGIIAFTPNVDRHYLAAGVGRQYFTLRYSDVKGRAFEHCGTLPSEIPADLTENDMCSFVEYTKAVK